MAELGGEPLRVGEAPTTDDEGAEMSTVDDGAEISVVCNICCEATEVFPLACCRNLICFSCVSKHAETAKSTFRCPFCKCDDATFFDCVSARGVVQRTSGLPDYAKTKISHPKRECEAASACACPRGLMFDSDKMMKIRGSQGGEDGWALRACDTCGQNARHERCGGGYVWTCGACGGGPLSVASSEEAAAASATSTPVVDRLLVEAAVEAKWRGGERWWPGRVAFVREDGAFDVKYDDGEEEERVPAYFVRPLARAGGRLTSGTFVIVYWNNEDGGGEWYPGTIKGKCPHSSKFQISYVDGEFAADYLTGSSGVAYRFIDQLPAAEDDDDARSEDEGAALAEEQRTVALPPLPPPPALPAAAPRPLLAAAEDELHGGITEEEQAVPFRVPHFLGSKDVAGARAASVQYFDQAWASTHDGELCPPAHYAGWSVVLTGGAREPTNFVDAAGVVYRRRKDAARAMGILAGPLSERATFQYSKYAKTPFGDQRALLLEPPPQAASPSPPLPSPPPSSHVQTQKRESGMDVIDGLEIVAEEAPSHVRQSFALADAHASTVAELEETIVARDETIVAREATIARHERTIAADAATIDAHEETIAARDEAIAARDETIARLKRPARDYEQPAAPARPPVSRPAAEAQRRSRPVKPGKQQRGTAARRPPPPPPPAEPEVIDLTSDDEARAEEEAPEGMREGARA
ncbi:hypothetical protein SO694_00037047 [Aureococcus anophagefferens]|uniref:RING-type domain-containing protein n=1 Tax=Aureococcus anophagefferens TaxID=44056 RepID=A0ABR1FKV4_AURAN